MRFSPQAFASQGCFPLRPTFAFLVSHPAHFLALGFGSGLSPKAPGTAGSLAAWPLYLLLCLWLSPVQILWLCIPFFALGIPVCGLTGRHLGVQDHGAIVWDEIVAMFAVLALAPQSLAGGLVAFAAFRLFDIWKPWPIGWLDARIHGGLGVMLDDALAAVYAIVLQALIWQGAAHLGG